MKILILLSYYNRPILVQNALQSIRKAHAHHADWHLVFGDDGSPVPGEPVVREIMSEFADRITFINSNLTFEEKANGGLVLGRFANEVIAASDADIGITLCDDDELCPLYLKQLSDFFVSHPDVMYCYSKIHLYNPLYQRSEDVDNISGRYNRWDGPVNPTNKLDASQVAFRLDCCRRQGVKFPDTTKGAVPWVENIDGHFFQCLYDKFGPAIPTNFTSQYKGIHDYQLVWHKKKNKEDLKVYMDQIRELGGSKF